MDVVENVKQYVTICAREVGKQAKDEFEIDMFNEFNDLKISSPIEQLFYTTFNYIQTLNSIFFPKQEPSGVKLIDGEEWCPGLGIHPQFKIGKYRVDFLISYEHPFRRGEHKDCLIVECDSQSFHDRTEPERRKEKARDRFLQSQGYKVFRFTGKEIMDNCSDLVVEVICHLTKFDKDDLMIDSNIED